MSRRLDDLVDIGGLTEGERQRLRSVHDLLVAAGPPPELPSELQQPPKPGASDDTVVPLPTRRDRRTVWALIAAAIAVACFGGGYAFGDQLQSGDDQVVRVVQMQGLGQTAHGSVSLGAVEPGGNWPIELKVTGLPKQSERAYYELFVWRNGKPGYPCGGFKMRDGTTTVRFTVPYELTSSTKLVVTAIERGKSPWPGRVVMTTT